MVDEDEPTDNDWEMTRTQHGDDHPLFDDEESHSGTQRPRGGDSNEMSSGPGKRDSPQLSTFIVEKKNGLIPLSSINLIIHTIRPCSK